MSTNNGRLITRRRERLACAECRRRKLKCDRSTPCTACVNRGHAASCGYQVTGNPSHTEAETRLQRLEILVNRLLVETPRSAPASTELVKKSQKVPTDQSEDTSYLNNPASSLDSTTYNGATHWSAISKEIDGLRDLLVADDEGTGEDSLAGGSSAIELLFGASKPTTIDELLVTSLPSRREVDSLVSTYFRSRTVTAPFLHSSSFRRLYTKFWDEPAEASPLWTSMLFSICHIASNALKLSSNNTSTQHQFSFAAARCLILGEYFKRKHLSVEALLLIAQAQCLTSQDMPSTIGPVFGILIRQATVMGYHREPSPQLFSPFAQEMRRRTWSLCMQLDLLTSFHLGLPSCVQLPTWDTQPPHNLLDSDFDEDTVELPKPRPEYESTEILLYIVKHRFMAVFEKILRHTLSPTTDAENFTELQALNQELTQVFKGLPDHLRPRSMADSVVDSPATVVTRLCVSFIYNKCICVLHRPYVTRYHLESIVACYDASTNIVRSFVDAYHQFTPGGQAESERWFLSSITWHDLLMGSTVICLLLWVEFRGTAPFPYDKSVLISLLQKAEFIIQEQANARTSETRKVLRLVQSTLRQFCEPDNVFTDRSQPSDKGQEDCFEDITDNGLVKEPIPVMEYPAINVTWGDLEQFMNMDGDTPGLNSKTWGPTL